VFRGSYHELKAEELLLTLKQKNMMGSEPIGTKLVPLTEVIDVNFAKTDMVIHKKALTLPIKDEDLDKDAQTCEL
jgi:hypothetical protein